MVRIFGVLLALLTFAATPSRAEDYPSRPIRILVPYSPGGISDIAARLVGAKLTEAWGQQVAVENRPGGSGFIAMEATARSAADGYTLVMCTVGDVSINPVLFKQMPYDVERDFAPISAVSDAPVVLAVNGNSPFKTVADVLAAAKAKPDTLNVGTPGYGSINQLVLEWMALNTGTKFVHVPYKGGAPAAQALAAGDIPLAILASSSVAPFIANGTVRVLAVTASTRSRLNPEWPTLKEQGAGDVNASNWTPFLAPKATPQPIIDKLNAKVVEILNKSDVKERFAAGGVATIPSTPAELTEKIRHETAVYKDIVEKANVHLD
ncbi:MAG TPA: tripartite tricarboxylate transporter substrate binding protein [Xanthobacteraceae bacterium]|jgi:tripartite-type tricarboxylate transporter receptor subunit TctC|nr:tripartite tricarboxylate transporter substrate binding protein [Xanthobacteraceae bacterium]